MGNKILISMIPKTSFFKNIRSEVSRYKWDKIRKDCYKRANYKCEVCGGKGRKHPVECHEVWVYNYRTKTQILKRLISLCPKCHQVKHYGLSQLRGLEKQCFRHMMKVNKWSCEEVHEHINNAWVNWTNRSKVGWNLDLSYLEKL